MSGASMSMAPQGWPDDLLLVSAIHQFLAQFRFVASYVDLVEMPHAAFERLDAAERGRIFEAALGTLLLYGSLLSLRT